jgi:hypothetical protein
MSEDKKKQSASAKNAEYAASKLGGMSGLAAQAVLKRHKAMKKQLEEASR